VWAAALTAAFSACSREQAKPLIDPAKAQQAYALGQRLAMQDREQRARHRAQMARLIEATVPKTRETGRTISLFVRLRNRSAKPITALDSGLFVFDRSGRRIGMAEIHLTRRVGGRESVAFWYPMGYVRFGEDAGTMLLAAALPKNVRMEVTEIRYADGSDAGYDD
jgi:hypothetical protein